MSAWLKISDLAMDLKLYAGLAYTLKTALDHAEWGNDGYYGAARILAEGLVDAAEKIEGLSQKALDEIRPMEPKSRMRDYKCISACS